ncbi:hypothetical protein CLOP_g1038 [Closterium sp. NIES-67]|nr:hypothetical protein CLOP_g24548 [Closterium sp. NIES-67]GJP70045.1 hypothetical protein CLOP_g1038 [Closterium sp. NIES-67]
MTVQSAHDGTRRVRLLVRLGKLLFSAQGRTRLLKVPPFSAQRLEDYMNGNEDSEQQRLKLPLHRVFETHVPDSVCSRLEGIVLENAEVAFEESEKYDIQVVDTWSRTIYRAACKYVADEKRFIIKKVKKFPVRYGVIEIARPGNALDVRLILTIETRLTTLDDPLGAAFSKVLHSAQIDPQSPGGVRIPEDMIEGRRGFDVAARESDTSSTASEGSSGIRSSTYNDVSSGVSDVSSGISGMGSRFSIASNSSLNSTGGSSCSEGSGRFQVRAARHLTVRRVVAEGRVWKFSRVDGIEYKQGAGRKTNMVEVFPAAWQQQLKGDSRGRERSKEQQPPTWSSEQIIGECPGLLAWLSVNLP